MSLLDRHLEFVEALRTAGLPVSLAEGLDAAGAITRLGIGDREVVRAGYAATLVKRPVDRPAFDRVFDLYFPPVVGEGVPEAGEALADTPEALADFRERLAEVLAESFAESDAQSHAEGSGSHERQLGALAREGVRRFGRIAGRGPGQQRWSSYNVMRRVPAEELVARVLGEGSAGSDTGTGPDVRRARERVARFERLVEAEVARRSAEVRGPEYVARHAVPLSVDQRDFLSARRGDLEEMRRQIQPLARKLATRVSRERRARRRGPLDFRRTVRASLSTGGVPLQTHHRARRPARTDLVALCDVSGSVASFAGFTLMLVYALREQFQRVRAFVFIDEVHEVTDRFEPGADPAETLAGLAASAQFASRWGRTSYGHAFTRFAERYGDALDPRTNLLVLGDARSNHTDLALPVVRDLVHRARHSWWLNPEHHRHWDTGDSAAAEYGALIPMVECRNLAQLTEFVHDLP